MHFTRRAALFGAGAAVGAVGTRWVGDRLPSADGLAAVPADASGTLNDASGLSQTPVFRHVQTAEDGDGLIALLRTELAAARAEGRPLNIGAARHSMGGQAIPRDGHALTFDNARLSPSAGGTYRVHAGARWHQVMAALDPLGLSPQVMQSNADFGVAATFSVNAHGWPVKLGPMGSTVRQITMMLSDGSVITASRDENAALFAAAMGGYGLIGLILDLEVAAVPNLALEPTFALMPAEAFATAFSQAVGEVPMAYGRLNVDRAGFFREAMLVTYAPGEGEVPPLAGSGWLSRVSRPIFRAQVGNEWAKRRRWWVETSLGPRFAGLASRNNLMAEPVATLDDRDPTRTDILHEYFLPPDAFGDFLIAARRIIPDSYQELLNITLRWVEQDQESLLSFAPDGPRIAGVMLFSQEISARGEADMAQLTGRLIDAVHDLGGSYYLPYRPHATGAQFRRGYARAAEFAALKRTVDPGLTLRNALWDTYLAEV